MQTAGSLGRVDTCLQDFFRLKAILPLDSPFQLQEEAHAVPHAHAAPHGTYPTRLAAACLGLQSSCRSSWILRNRRLSCYGFYIEQNVNLQLCIFLSRTV